MELNEDMRFHIVNEQGEEVECIVLFTFEMNDRMYMVYTDQTRTELGELNISACIVEEERLLPVESAEEWAVIQEELNKLIDQVKGED